MSMNIGTRRGMGRKKIDIKKIEKKESLIVTFSKRRKGLFTKAGQLCVLCGAEVAVIVFSPHGRPYVFGHPSADSVIDRFLDVQDSAPRNNMCPNNGCGALQVHGNNHVGADHEERTFGLMKVQKEVNQAAKVTEKPDEKGFWWETPINSMGLNELEQHRASMVDLRNMLAMQLDEMDKRSVVTRDFFAENLIKREKIASGVLNNFP